MPVARGEPSVQDRCCGSIARDGAHRQARMQRELPANDAMLDAGCARGSIPARAVNTYRAEQLALGAPVRLVGRTRTSPAPVLTLC